MIITPSVTNGGTGENHIENQSNWQPSQMPQLVAGKYYIYSTQKFYQMPI